MTVINHTHIANVVNRRGSRVNELAARLDLSNDTVEHLIRGTGDPSDLRVGTLVNMADHLGIPFAALFHQPDLTPDPDDPSDPDDPDDVPASDPDDSGQGDAEQLIAAIYDQGPTPTAVRDVAAAFTWTMERVHRAATDAAQRLQPAGLRMVDSHSELTIIPTRDHLDAQKALAERKVYERGLTLSHYKAAHQILTGQPVTVTNSRRQRDRTLGGLVNLGIIDGIHNAAFTAATREAFL